MSRFLKKTFIFAKFSVLSPPAGHEPSRSQTSPQLEKGSAPQLLFNGTSQFIKVDAAAAITPVGPGSGAALNTASIVPANWTTSGLALTGVTMNRRMFAVEGSAAGLGAGARAASSRAAPAVMAQYRALRLVPERTNLWH